MNLSETLRLISAFVLDSWTFGICFLIGLLAGGQTFYAKAGSDAFSLLWNPAGLCYWITRGIFPVIVYILWYKVKAPHEQSLLVAVGSGLGCEAILRSRFYISDKKTNAVKSEEVFKGVFDLLVWYQSILLKLSGEQAAEGRRKLVESIMSAENDFPQLLQRARTNARAWPIKEEEQKLQALFDSLAQDFRKERDASIEVHREYALQLGYAALRLTSRDSLKTLFKK